MPILGIGNDIIYNHRIERIIQKYPDKFPQRILGNNEAINIDLLTSKQKKINYLAKRFSAKESFAKAIGTGIGRLFNFNDIEILNNNLGKPEVSFAQNILTRITNYLKTSHNLKTLELKTHISISDDQNLIQTFVIIENIC